MLEGISLGTSKKSMKKLIFYFLNALNTNTYTYILNEIALIKFCSVKKRD